MGANLCTLRHPISDQNSSPSTRDGRSRLWACSSFKEFIKSKCLNIENRRRFRGSVTKNMKRKMEKEVPEKKIPEARKLTLEDWILASPGLKADYLRRGELCAFKQCKKKVHPCSTQFRGSLLGEARDSLSLDRHRTMNRHEESEGMSNCSSISRSFSGKSHKRVSFKLPHIVIVYSPDEPYCEEASSCSPEELYSSEDSFSSPMGPNCSPNSFDTAEEPYVRLAVDTLPHVFVSSRI